MRRAALALLGLCLALSAGPAMAQRVADARPVADTQAAPAPAPAVSAVLVIDTERLFAETRFGQRIARELQQDSEALAEENRALEAELTAEEQSLTERRADMTPEAFRAEAEAFDAKVQQIRRERDARERALQQEIAQSRERFLAAAGPTLGEVMIARGASVMLDRRAVFLSTGAVDATDAAIAALDAAVGDGAEIEDAPRGEDPAPR
ncbi:OmpH family outer membrane protein [Limimaricola pyoseonensis]|uniref:Chaperone for outer membrane proteins, Skp family n=1 Tax=Limimaricola pyoseonensis TaxID=521013 RepID=A0A1G7A634_9RHOB|nr:OmpH family outer membrane protein [Limimaricola pyoseonensis]SDE10272.1 chaperone for outer membrane proteins, Skp family [Limimaricola pyoseonensis]